MSEPSAEAHVDNDYDAELEEMKRRVALMEQEMEASRSAEAPAGSDPAAQPGLNGSTATSSAAEDEAAQVAKLVAGGDDTATASEEDAEVVDSRSIFVGNVDYAATPEEIQGHFQSCGSINRVTILCDKFTGHPKGFAYVEFADSSFVENASALNDSMFRGRLIKVTPKRTNIPGFNARGRGRGRGGYRGGHPRGAHGYQPYRARGRGRGRGY